MISKHLTSPLVLAVSLGLAACGGSNATPPPAGKPSIKLTRLRPTELYKVAMSGAAETPRGAPHGRGVAVIAFHGASRLCFRLSHLHGFVGATVAHIHSGTAGHSGPVVVALSSGAKLRHRGCRAISPTVARAISRRPSAYYINVHSRQYPAGAVRAQL
jgi:hypothetical protein